MPDTALRRWTGIAGVLTFFLLIAIVPLYFIYSGPPPRVNVLARSIVGMVSLVPFLAFMVGLQAMIRRARPDDEVPPTLLLSVGIVWITVTFVATAHEAGRVLGRTDLFDPTLVGSGAEGSLVIYGPVGRILTSTFLALVGTSVLRTGILPAWAGRAALALSAVQLAFVATFFAGTLPEHFFSVNGWHLPVLGSLLSLWILAASVALLRPSPANRGR
ncbi:MAG: hypothetical protein ACRENU_10960 [Gemmatimonadaceae bacterium]